MNIYEKNGSLFCKDSRSYTPDTIQKKNQEEYKQKKANLSAKRKDATHTDDPQEEVLQKTSQNG